MTLTYYLVVSAAGAAGAVARFYVDTAINGGRQRAFPTATLAINISGSFVLGLVAGFTVHAGTGLASTAIGIGFCGGYTTFSTSMVDTVRLLQKGQYSLALVYTAASALGSLLAASVGFAAGASGW